MKEISVKSADRAAKRHGIIKAKVAFVTTVAQWLGCLGEEGTLDELVAFARGILGRSESIANSSSEQTSEDVAKTHDEEVEQ